MEAKFRIGDRVRINARGNQYLYDEGIITRKRTRTITRIKYSKNLEANLYYLGNNSRGNSDLLYTIPFRSYQLTLVNGTGNAIGRPKTKRKYNRKGWHYLQIRAMRDNNNLNTKVPVTSPNDGEKPSGGH